MKFPPMNTTRAQGTATRLHDGGVLIAGGHAGYQAVSPEGAKYMSEPSLNSAELYDPQANSFAPSRLTRP
jgi:hypothetical protein